MRLLLMVLIVAFLATGCGRQEVYAPSNSQITVLGSNVLLEDASGGSNEHFFVIKERASNTTTIEVGRQGQVPQFKRPPAEAAHVHQPQQSTAGYTLMMSVPYGYGGYPYLPQPYPYQYPYGYTLAAPWHYPVSIVPPVYYHQP